MSLSKIGKVSNAVKLLNTAATSGDIATGISSLSNSLRAAGNMSAGVNWISKYGKVLDSGIAYQALKQAFPEESLTEDMLAKIGYTANGAGKVGNASKFSSVGSTFAGLGTFLKSIWPVLAVVGGIAAGTAAWKWADDKFTITKATAKKHSDESAQAYQNAKTELSTKQSQYDTNQDRIHELRATQNRTSDENAELSQLTKENSLLGTQVSVQKKLVDAKAQQQAIDADMNLNKKYTTTCDSQWGYTPLILCKTTSSSTLPREYSIQNNSDCWEDYVYPTIKVSPKSHGIITIKNKTDNGRTMKINALKSDDFYIDCRNLKIYDITKSIVSFEDLGIEDIDDIYWPRLAYGENIFEFTGDATFEISYREPRKVGAFA